MPSLRSHSFSLSQKIELARDVCAGMAHLHQEGILHRVTISFSMYNIRLKDLHLFFSVQDLAARNLLLVHKQTSFPFSSSSTSQFSVKVTDFGLSRRGDEYTSSTGWLFSLVLFLPLILFSFSSV